MNTIAIFYHRIVPSVGSITVSEDSAGIIMTFQNFCKIPASFHTNVYISGRFGNRILIRIIAGKKTKDSRCHGTGINFHSGLVGAVQDLNGEGWRIRNRVGTIGRDVSQDSGAVVCSAPVFRFFSFSCIYTSVISTSDDIVCISFIGMIQLCHDAGRRTYPVCSIGCL